MLRVGSESRGVCLGECARAAGGGGGGGALSTRPAVMGRIPNARMKRDIETPNLTC